MAFVALVFIMLTYAGGVIRLCLFGSWSIKKALIIISINDLIVLILSIIIYLTKIIELEQAWIPTLVIQLPIVIYFSIKESRQEENNK